MKTLRRQGFTLLELLVVIAVMAVVSTIGTTLFFRVNDAWKSTTVRMDLNTAADRALAMMRHDFDQILSAKLTGVSLTGISRMEEEKRFGRVPLEDDAVILPLAYRDFTTGNPVRQSVMYRIDRSGPVPELLRIVGDLGANPPEGTKQMIAQGCLSLRMEYFDGAVWRPEWNNPALPEAVRASIVLMNPDRNWEQIARKAVFNLHVK